MSVFTYSVALFIIGGIIAAAFNVSVGIVMMVMAAAGMLFSLLRFVESDVTIRQSDVDRQIEDVLRHHPR